MMDLEHICLEDSNNDELLDMVACQERISFG
jgi:hypothetical protein